MPDVITIGESMLALMPPGAERLTTAHHLDMRVGGAESNVAIGLARLGVSTKWLSALGDDAPGELILQRVRAEGVDTTAVRRAPERTGVYLREYTGVTTRVYYYRDGSAASRLDAGSFDAHHLDGIKFLHLTGITPALSESCRRLTEWAVDTARARGARISFDVNYRAKLWPSRDAREFIESLLDRVDVLFVSREEADHLWGGPDDDLARDLARRGPNEVVIKRGADGCVVHAGGTTTRHAAFPAVVVDPVGAGDAFCAAYLAATLWNEPVHARARAANAAGALCVAAPGDYDGAPYLEDLKLYLSEDLRMQR